MVARPGMTLKVSMGLPYESLTGILSLSILIYSTTGENLILLQSISVVELILNSRYPSRMTSTVSSIDAVALPQSNRELWISVLTP